MKDRPRRRRLFLLLLLAPFIGLLWPGFYNSTTPALIGIPFFYWYQLLWVVLGALVTWLVYRLRAAE